MGHIIEPDGIDFLIQSPPLTDKERIEISDYIRSQKNNLRKKKQQQNSSGTSKTSVNIDSQPSA